MNNKKLEKILKAFIGHIDGSPGHWNFTIDEVRIICLTDELHNRMRFIAPIEEVKNMNEDNLLKCLEANFHTALDIKYAISDDVLWAAFLHPLKELTSFQVKDALQQIYAAVATYGASYSSSNLYFPTQQDRKNRMN